MLAGSSCRFYEARIAVRAGGTNVLPFTIWSPLIDTAHQVTLPSPTLRETVVTTPLIPGLELHLPAGTVIKDEDHQVARTVSLTPIPLDSTPFPLPDSATFSMFFTIQPGGAYLSTPGPIKGGWLVYPNVRQSRAGSRVQFFNYDPDDKGWYPYGMGTITATSVIPDPKTCIYGFTGASFNDGTPTPPAGPPPGDSCGNDGDPVNLTTGIFTYEMTDLVVSDVLPLVLTRTYNSQDPYARPFGVGMRHSFGLFMHSEVWHSEADLYLPDGGKIHFARISDPSLPVEETVFEHAATPTAFYKATMTFWGEPIGDHGWNVTLKDGTVYVFPHAGSPLQAIRDRHGNEIRLTWASGLLQRITSPNGRWIAFSYGTGGRVSQVSDNIGRTVGYTYDASGRLSTVTDPENHVTSYSWDTNNRMTGVRPPNLQGTQTNLVTNEYTTGADAPTPVGWVKKQTHADGGVYQFAYTVSNGRSMETDVTDPRGYVRRVTFNPDGYTLSDTRALGQPEEQTTTSERLGAGNFVTSSTDTLQAKTVSVLDAFGNPTSVTRCLPGQSPCTDASPGALTIRFTYEPTFNQVGTITDPLNHTTTYEYDEAGNLTSITDPLQHERTFTYNAQGQRTSITDALEHSTTFGYTGGDLTTITDAESRVTTRFTDAAGRTLAVTNPLGQTTRYVYDQNNRLTRLTDAAGRETSFTYFPAGQLRSVTDANQRTATYTMDVMGRLASRTDPLQRTEAFTYDLAGNLHQWMDRKGQVTSHTYDALNRLDQITYADTSTISYTYDDRSRISDTLDSIAGPMSFAYDDFDRLISETTLQGSIGYTYDAAGRRSTRTAVGQPTLTYTYDHADRLTGLSSTSQSVVMTYDDANRRTSLTLPTGVVTEYEYNDANEVTRVAYRSGQSLLGDLTYSYDSAGQRIEVGGGWARVMLPQAVALGSYDAANQLTSWVNETRSYDANGDLASDGLTSYTWDARHRLWAMTGATSAAFTYDSVARRVGATVEGTSTSYAYDGANAVADTRGAATTVYLAGPGLDQWFSRVDGTGIQSFLTDPLGSVVAVADSANGLVTQYTYEPFGATTVSGSPANAIRFTGREADNTGLYFYRARYYDPRTERFISEDPVRVLTPPNFYAYVENKPLEATDPTGLKIKICSRPAFVNPLTGSFGNHAFFWDTRNGDNCGRGAGNSPHGSENITRADTFCNDVPGSQGSEDAVMECCRQKAASWEGRWWSFPVGDCNALTSRCLENVGLPNIPPPGGRFGCASCEKAPKTYPPLAPYMKWQ